jgi:transposase
VYRPDEKNRSMTDAVLGIDVSKTTLDTSLLAGTKPRSRSFANSPDGWRQLIAWLSEHRIRQVHACLEATGRYSLGIALALHEARHVVSLVNAAQIREYAELFKPRSWTPPSQATRRLCELQTIRAGMVASLTEWKNRSTSGMADDRALSLAKATIQHFTSQLEAVDQAIAETIDNDPELCAKRNLLVSISGVGETLAGIVLAELPGPEVLGSSAAVAAYAGLNPRQHQSGTSINRPARISKIGNAVLRTALYMPALSAMRYNPAIAALVGRLKAQGRLTGKQIVVAAMRKLLVICFGVLKSGKEFDPAIALGQ